MTDMNARKLLILTFDDGPSDEYTPRVLTALEKVKWPSHVFHGNAYLKRRYNDYK